MKYLKRFLLLMLIVALFQTTLVLADVGDSLNRAMDTLGEPLTWLWNIAPYKPSFPFFVKTLYFFMLYAALYNGALAGFKSRLEGEQGKTLTRALKVITLVVSLIAALGTPQEWLMTIFAWNTAILVLVTALLFPLILYFIAMKVFKGDDGVNRTLRGIFLIIVGLFMIGMIEYMQMNPSSDYQVYEQFLWVFEILGAIAVFVGIATILMGLGAGKAADKGWNLTKGLFGGNTETPTTNVNTTSDRSTTPPQDPGQIGQLLSAMNSFNVLVGNPSSAGAQHNSLYDVIYGQVGFIQRYRADIEVQQNAVIKQTYAQAHMQSLNPLHIHIATIRTQMETILRHAQYLNVPVADRTMFEGHITYFLQCEHDFSVVYINTLQWL